MLICHWIGYKFDSLARQSLRILPVGSFVEPRILELVNFLLAI